MTYQKDTAKSDLTYTVESSTDMINWSNGSVTEQVLSTNGTVQTVKASIAKGSSGKVFLRLKVTK
jgi:hypothetical protein